MLKLLPIEIFLRLIPEAFILILAGYAFSSKEVEKKLFCVASILLAMATYFVRMLPIHFGVHTIILLVIYVLLSVKINKIDIVKAMSAGLISSIILFLCEWINVFTLTKLLNINVDIVFKSPVKKCIYLLPSIMLFGLIISLIFYTNVLRKKGCKNVFY
ncbi:hypothetical protein [Clostridium magnum]|uniref:Uncharacterized protein n=1 Tax=Clostridium magnum DSM 2767 TaxID=1121326 RepID=A0A162R5K1_9CLOT|nr:hypothetical protein [Clostridium magnum]KZL89460.1 hypothetical protein CLMAG_53640 [Clostridium magnum DSM 2767]SHI20192.1 hypothetical protein SAMN02745944_03155 [Clostridium magnum DSM 2767]